jgi:hypothetical protein
LKCSNNVSVLAPCADPTKMVPCPTRPSRAFTSGLPVPEELPDMTTAPHGNLRRRDFHPQVQQLASLRRFDGNIEALRLPAAPLAALCFLRLAVPREHASFRSRRRCVLQRQAWGWSLGNPFRAFSRGDDRISQVPGEPRFPSAHVLRPRPTDAALTTYRTLAWPPMSERRRHRRPS